MRASGRPPGRGGAVGPAGIAAATQPLAKGASGIGPSGRDSPIGGRRPQRLSLVRLAGWTKPSAAGTVQPIAATGPPDRRARGPAVDCWSLTVRKAQDQQSSPGWRPRRQPIIGFLTPGHDPAAVWAGRAPGPQWGLRWGQKRCCCCGCCRWSGPSQRYGRNQPQETSQALACGMAR